MNTDMFYYCSFQMDILKILALLGRGDQASSEGMYEVLVDVMRRADTGINVGYAIVYESVRTVTTIYPNPLLLDAAATAISRFIRSESHNLKYIGIKGLAAIVNDHPRYTCMHVYIPPTSTCYLSHTLFLLPYTIVFYNMCTRMYVS